MKRIRYLFLLALFSNSVWAVNYTIKIGNNTCTDYQQYSVPSDTEVALYAHPDEGYIFMQWSDGNTENPRIVTITSDITYQAEFAATFPLPTMHTVTIYADECDEPVIKDFTEGETLTVYAHPSLGYAFNQWSDGNTDNPRMVTITEDATYRALFEVSTAPNPDGVYTFTVNAANCSTSLSQIFSQGTEVKLYAEPIDCNYFIRWSDGNTDNPRTVVVNDDATYTAEFEPVQYTITVESVDETQGSVDIEIN